MANPRGGILLRLLFSMALVGLGFSLCRIMDHRLDTRPLSRLWDKAGDLAFRRPSAPLSAAAESQAAWLQGQTRRLLAKYGANEDAIVKMNNEQRRQGGVQWVEGTIEMSPPPGFNARAFVTDLQGVIKQSKMTLMKDETQGRKRVLEIGDSVRVYQRIVWEVPFRAR